MRSSSRAARAAVLLGALAVIAIPAAVAAAQLTKGLRLLENLYVAVPVACILGLAAVSAARRARFQAARSVRSGGRLRAARFLAWAGLYAGVTGALALGVYGVLRWAQ